VEHHRPAKALYWIGSSLREVRAFPKAVRRVMGQALDDAQHGEKHPGVKPLRGFGGAGVLEIVEDNDGDTYRAIYTVKFAGAVYVLHAFQKKAKRGRVTLKKDIDLVKRRLRVARERNGSRQ
jgi:phage-related protein